MAVHTVNEREAEGHLLELAALAARGNQVQIALNSGQVVKLELAISSSKTSRVAGLHNEQGWVSEDFDAPLDNVFGLDKASH